MGGAWTATLRRVRGWGAKRTVRVNNAPVPAWFPQHVAFLSGPSEPNSSGGLTGFVEWRFGEFGNDTG